MVVEIKGGTTEEDVWRSTVVLVVALAATAARIANLQEEKLVEDRVEKAAN